MIVIIDYGIGNTGSMLNMFRRVGSPAMISGKLEDIERASRIVIPGVGAFDKAVERIDQINGLRNLLNDKVVRESTWSTWLLKTRASILYILIIQRLRIIHT